MNPKAAPLADRVPRDVVVRVAITLGVLAVYYLGLRVPLPGLHLTALEHGPFEMGGSAAARISVLALGVMPWFNALILGEVLWLLFAGVRRWRAGNERAYQRAVLILALLFAALQAHGVALAISQMPELVAQPGDGFIQPAVLTLFAGSVLSILMASVVTRDGIGSGFWVLFLAPSVLGLPGMIDFVTGGLTRGEFVRGAVLVIPLIAIAAVAISVAVLRQRTDAGFTEQSGVVWPALIGSILAGWIFAFVSLRVISADGTSNTLGPGDAVYEAVIAGMIVLVGWRYGAIAGFSSLGLKTGVMVAGIAVLPDLFLESLDLPPVIGGSALIIAVTVLFSFAQVWQRAEKPGTRPGAESGPDPQSL